MLSVFINYTASLYEIYILINFILQNYHQVFFYCYSMEKFLFSRNNYEIAVPGTGIGEKSCVKKIIFQEKKLSEKILCISLCGNKS